jgi:tricorn protease-like protein
MGDIFVRDRQDGTTELVSVSGSGAQANGDSQAPSISSDGRFVAFQSQATNLVPNDINHNQDVFVHDRQTGTTEIVSVSGSGAQGNNFSYQPSISSDGRFVAFYSDATTLVPDDTNARSDVFVHDRQEGTTERMSVDSSGAQGNGGSGFPSISSDGRFVTFSSHATNLVPGDTNDTGDIFVHDQQMGTTNRVSVSSSGDQANNGGSYGSLDPSISSDGRFVAFQSDATNLVPGDTNGTYTDDIFVHDQQTGTTQRVSVSSSCDQTNFPSYKPSISSDGRFVTFASIATNLVPDDTNDTVDVFVHDRQTGTTQRVNVDSLGNRANGGSVDPSISSDGRFVVFDSDATNLVPGDTNGQPDVFVHEFKLDATAPKVESVVPAKGAIEVSRDINLNSTFSEPVYYVKANFRLYPEGSSTPVAALVTPVAGTNNTKWVLNPDKALKPNTTYYAKIFTGVKDKVGNKLDQNPTQAGNQPMVWSFETGTGR